jgi:CheY-specific phosphatase CheX
MRLIKNGDFEYLQSSDGQVMFTFQNRAVKKLSHQIYTYITTTNEFNEHTRRTLKEALSNILITSSFYPEIKPEAILTDLFTMWTLIVELRSTLHQINGVGYDRMNPKRL